MRARSAIADVRIRQQLERGAALAVLVEREAVTLGFVRRQRNRFRKRPRGLQRRHFRHRMRAALGADAADRDALSGQPLIGIVGAQRQPIFGARGEHAVRLGDAARDQIVDHHAEIAFGAIEDDFARRRRPAPPH